MLTDESTGLLDLDQLADAVVDSLANDAVSRWAEEVQAAITAARSHSHGVVARSDGPKDLKGQRLKAQIRELTRQLRELESD